MRKRYGKAGLGLAAGVAVAAVLFVPWGGTAGHRATAAEVFAQAIAAVAELQSVHMKLNVRTTPNENFAAIHLDAEMVPQEMWADFGDPPRWRVEKAGRVAVMDGRSSLLLIDITASVFAVRGSVNQTFDSWQELTHVDRVLDTELRLAEKMGWDLELTHEQGPDGQPRLVVTIEARAQGDFTHDWCKNKSISASDNRRVYRFDAGTHRLEDLEVWVHAEEGDVLVLDITEIEYDAPTPDELFALSVPDDVIWVEEPAILPNNQQYARMTAAQAARAFFSACAAEDWDEVRKFGSVSEVPQGYKDLLGRLEILRIGEPFESGRYPGLFVPYEVRLNSGVVKSGNLALRDDNPARRFVVDGGI